MDRVAQKHARLCPALGTAANTSFASPALQFDGLDDLLWIEDFELSSTETFGLSFFFRADPPGPAAGYGYI